MTFLVQEEQAGVDLASTIWSSKKPCRTPALERGVATILDWFQGLCFIVNKGVAT